VNAWPSDPDALARAILTDTRFGGFPSGPRQPSLWDQFVKWALDRLRDFLGPLVHALSGTGPQSALLGAALLITGGAALIYLLVRAIEWFAFRTAARRGDVQRRALIPAASAAELRARARAAAAAGVYRDAAGLLFAAALRALDESGRHAYDAALTPGEYRRAVRDPFFDVLAREATVALFATVEPDAGLVARMERAYDGLFAPA
jgi:hypothetical protein